MNLAATAFVERDAKGFSLRCLSSTVELSLCGHGPSLRHTSCRRERLAQTEPLQFETGAGPLTTRREGEWIEMDTSLPSRRTPSSRRRTSWTESGPSPSGPGRSRLDYLAELESEEVTLMVQDLSDRSQVVFDDEPLKVEVDVIRL